MAKSTETKAERQARERREAQSAHKASGGEGSARTAREELARRRKARAPSVEEINSRINRGYVFASIKEWCIRLLALSALAYAFHFLIFGGIEWLENHEHSTGRNELQR
jgi:hypothetical protein